MIANATDDVTGAPVETELRTGQEGRFLGVDVGGTSIKWSILQGGAVDATGSIDTPRVDHHAVLRAVADLAHEVAQDLSGIGVAVPGTVDPARRRSVFIPNLPGDWQDFAVAAELEQFAGVSVALLNDARAFAWAEHTSGSAKGVPNAVFITLGTGVGGAIALDGRILVGELDSIGEMGHVPVDPHGERCACGGRGCLETIASGSAIVGRLARTVAMAQSPILRRLTQQGAVPLTARLVADAARLGDPWAKDAFDRAGDALGQAAGMIGLLLQLDVVVIGGGLGPAADLYLPRIQESLDSRTSLTGRIEVRTAHYGSEAGSIGAATFAAQQVSDMKTKPTPERTY